MAFVGFTEMGFSKIESQHKSQHAKKRQTKNKSHTTLMKIADTLSELRKAKHSTAQNTDECSVFFPWCMFSFRIKNVFLSSSSSSFTKLERKKIHFLAWTNVATELCQDFLRFDVKYTHRARNRQEPMRPTNEYIMVMDVSNNIWKIRLNKKLASDLKPSLSVVFFFGGSCLEKVSSSNFTP